PEVERADRELPCEPCGKLLRHGGLAGAVGADQRDRHAAGRRRHPSLVRMLHATATEPETSEVGGARTQTGPSLRAAERAADLSAEAQEGSSVAGIGRVRDQETVHDVYRDHVSVR